MGEQLPIGELKTGNKFLDESSLLLWKPSLGKEMITSTPTFIDPSNLRDISSVL